jgi:hypothetical protein
MILPYTKLPSNDPNFPFFLRPMLGVEISYGSRAVMVNGHLDTGADHTLINKSWAKQLGIEWKTGRLSYVTGIVGNPVPVYLHEIYIEVLRLPSSKIPVTAAFIDSPRVGTLLGQAGFFDHFKVTFDRLHNSFEIDLA